MKTAIFLLSIWAVVMMAYSPKGSHSESEKAELKSFGKPDEVREFPKGRVELIKIGGATVGRATFEPGWKWSTSKSILAVQFSF